MELSGLEELMNRDSIRLECGCKWLVYDAEWFVYQQKLRQRTARILYQGDSQGDAVDTLLNN